jgi:hypothetical protein
LEEWLLRRVSPSCIPWSYKMKTAKISIVGFGSIGAGLATEIAKKKIF